ncbi:MAG: RHS repeat-associated core domain-containing protein [Verrucomicrobiota bacterium]|nr:RHS repeat-associated core domain-containing protein [Verrucomicrobiota bacterium]
MGYLLSDSPKKKSERGPKKPRLEFFSISNKSNRLNRLQVVEPHQEKKGEATKTASGVTYYEYRFYNPQTGRWISRDPIAEDGGINVYCFVNNDSVNFWDLLGMVCPVKITLSGASNGKVCIARTYPDQNHKAYEVPVSTLTVSCGNKVSCGKPSKSWDALRFMPYLNTAGGHGYTTKASATPIMTGLADKREAPSPQYKANYGVPNRPSNEDGAIVITGTFYIHAGPTSLTEYSWGAAGCTEVVGFTAMKAHIAELSDQPGKSVEEAIKEFVRQKMLIIKLEQATRPAPKEVLMPPGYSW